MAAPALVWMGRVVPLVVENQLKGDMAGGVLRHSAGFCHLPWEPVALDKGLGATCTCLPQAASHSVGVFGVWSEIDPCRALLLDVPLSGDVSRT